MDTVDDEANGKNRSIEEVVFTIGQFFLVEETENKSLVQFIIYTYMHF